MNMGKVRTGLAVSLDGFISGPNDDAQAPMGHGGERLLAWYGAGDTEYRLPGTDMVFMVSAQTAEFLRETREQTGRWCLVEGPSISPMGGVASTPWMSRSLW
jgi:hypothetical protein